MMLKWLKKDKGLTLLETVVAMLIISSSAAGILGSFSYAFKFTQRAGKKMEAMNLQRKALETYRAIWLAAPGDTRLDITTESAPGKDITSSPFTWLAPNYDGKIYLTIKNWPNDTNPSAKQLTVSIDWAEP